ACGSYPVGGRWGQNFTLDTSKYSRLAIRMYTDKVDPFGIRFIWDRSCNYAASRTVTEPQTIKTGWHTYTFDFNSIALDAATVQTPWSSGSITGLAVLPTTQSGANIQVEYIRLEDPNSCGSYTASYTATAAGNNGYYNLYLD